MIKFLCDKCSVEISDLKEAVNIQYAEQKVISQDGKLKNLWVEQKKMLCEKCKELIMEIFKNDKDIKT